ncbi:DUF3180 domain-containing protein [Amycolatopsis endophytica]|uniref:DUF3180 domain-containing protein n=1 Tax=Amycolatopsis endophytica TaxID=860233 RepID=A0A853B216_9PSEU|nr:DUF3180 domain-containing protein [Amycolatopsis endophytica]NYI89029.1 hypothetical protein [Amycolatopsis endophytica]
MHFTRPRELVIAGLIGLVAAYLLFEFAYGDLPRLPRLAGVSLLVLAVIEVALAFSMRSRIKSRRVVNAVSAARTVALAKASSLLGAIMLGAWAGITAALLPRASELAAASSDLRSVAIGAVCAVALIAAALWLEHCCRTPEDDERDPDHHPTG